MNCIHENKVNNIVEYNWLHDILNPSKHTKSLNIHCSPIIHGCMNTQRGRAKFKNFQIFLDSGYSSTILTRRPIKKLNPKEDNVMKCHMPEGNITTNLKVKIDFTFPELNAT